MATEQTNDGHFDTSNLITTCVTMVIITIRSVTLHGQYIIYMTYKSIYGASFSNPLSKFLTRFGCLIFRNPKVKMTITSSTKPVQLRKIYNYD